VVNEREEKTFFSIAESNAWFTAEEREIINSGILDHGANFQARQSCRGVSRDYVHHYKWRVRLLLNNGLGAIGNLS
jgi:hypothetical protein